ncbi:discoidin domain-containing protein [Rosistilla oblonga]|uniref:DUF7133 domain-containing protein n=1 Tax=Rosistilla oblonga TaxID=2527990 RepID=UPI003A97D85F
MNKRFCFRPGLLCQAILLTQFFSLAASACGEESKSKEPAGRPPLRALLIAGGCCHDYAGQQAVIAKELSARANVRVDVYWTDDKTVTPPFPLFERLDWADGYDVIIHDECAAGIRDQAIVNRILQVHQKIPAVHLHCAMHSFRTGGDAWFRHLGLQSNSHGPQKPIAGHYVDPQHPITKTLTDWTTINEELYNNVKIFDAKPLAMGKQVVGKDGKEEVVDAIVAWTTERDGIRGFSTTLGHNTATVADDKYMDLVTRGLLWACDRLTEEDLRPYSGSNKVTFIDSKLRPSSDGPADVMPNDATLVRMSSSSTQTGHPLAHAIDGSDQTRWCAANGSYPQWIQFEFEQPRAVAQIGLKWESNHIYRYRVEGSNDAKTWTIMLDQTDNQNREDGPHEIAQPKAFKFLRLTGVGCSSGGNWCSIREIRLKGEGINALWPADPDGEPQAFKPLAAELYTSFGNAPPEIRPLSPEREAEILKDVKVADGFEATIFAAPPAVNYPVFVAAAPEGTLYVSSDGNGSLGRDPERGRVIRLRDLDGDGRADETKTFCTVDAPRGLVWDRDRLYLMHPPHLSEFIDHDLDGIADEQKILVRDLAFGYDKRPADHTTNGVSLGADGWLYIAGGDFGFMNAVGRDGRKLQHRGGGVIRVRTDGTGLEVYSTGTRNILEVAISPRMDLFARDNTNDGGGWDVRLHHFTGMDDHGYPRLYKNFADECVAPLADYGGGSGCGAVYLDEPGFGQWNDAPLTADWGTGGLYRHTVEPKGSTFVETAPPEPIVKMTRPTDADVDGNSGLYVASWRGATFKWEGPNVGYIVRVTPKDFQPEPMIDFAKASDEDLVAAMESTSYRRRIAAQRELKHRNHPAAEKLLADAKQARSSDRNFVERLQTAASDDELIKALAATDPVIVHVAIRTLAHRGSSDVCWRAIDGNKLAADAAFRALAMMHSTDVVDSLIDRLAKADAAADRRAILATLCRLHFHEGVWNGQSWGTRPDTRGPYYQPEPWQATPKIAATLKAELAKSSGDEAAWLVQTMTANRIESTEALDRLLQLAASDASLIPTAVTQLAAASDVSPAGLALLTRAANSSEASPATLAEAVAALTKVEGPDAVAAIVTAMDSLSKASGAREQLKSATAAFLKSPKLDQYAAALVALANDPAWQASLWADAGLIALAEQKDRSPETREIARQAIDSVWANTSNRDRAARLIRAAAATDSHLLDEQILASINASDATLAEAAKSAAKRLKLKPRPTDMSLKVSSLAIETALQQAVAKPGDVSWGQQVFAKANCTACHTISKDEPQKGPFLGNIARTYKRPELAAAILQPSKTIAQGFVTNVIVTVDGDTLTGFVTNEQSDRVTLRDHQAKEYTVMKDDIEIRKTLPTSVMPDGLMNTYSVHDLASLLDYLESLSE